jgi:type VI secretion system protein ImpA
MAIDIDDYLKDIDPDNVCGEDLEYDREFNELEEAIKGKPEQQMGDTFIEAEPPNWRDVKKRAEALMTRTIDLRILIFYLRALLAMEGFSGLQDGLLLIKTAVEKYWDGLYPLLDVDDDNDPTERINTLMSLCDYETVIRALQQTTLIESQSLGRFNYRQISIASGKSTATSKEKDVAQSIIDAAIQDSSLESLQQNYQFVTNGLENLNQLESLVTDYVGISNAPSFAELRNFLKECKTFLSASLERKGGATEESPNEIEAASGEPITVSSNNQKSALGVINNNQDVIKTLNQVCDYYHKHEPSSPVPFFVERAIRVVGKNFIDVLKDIAPTGVDEARTILGKQDDEDEYN